MKLPLLSPTGFERVLRNLLSVRGMDTDNAMDWIEGHYAVHDDMGAYNNSCPGFGPLAGFQVITSGRFWVVTEAAYRSIHLGLEARTRLDSIAAFSGARTHRFRRWHSLP